MARVHRVEHARKAIPSAGIEVGDSYYWWAFMVGGRGGPRHVSKTYPRRSQTTQSEFYAGVYDLEDRIGELDASIDAGAYESGDDLKSELEDIVSEIRQLGEEQGEKFDNMPEGLQQSDIGQMLEERRDACESWADAIESIEVEEVDEAAVIDELKADRLDGEGAPTQDEIDEAIADKLREHIQAAIDEAQSASVPS
jgi:hypothetical protein